MDEQKLHLVMNGSLEKHHQGSPVVRKCQAPTPTLQRLNSTLLEDLKYKLIFTNVVDTIWRIVRPDSAANGKV
ncbi:hypothetical protein E4U13_006741, partial [Claviceps humidiphila]